MSIRPLSRRSVLGAAVAASGLGAPLAALAGFNFFLNEYTATRDELQAELVKHFPVTRRYAELFAVTLRNPQLALDGQANRAAITAHIEIASPLLPSTAPGLVSISSALRYDAPARTLRLVDPRAEQLALQGVTGTDAQRLQRIGGAVAQELLRDYPLHTFRPEELTVGRKTYEIGDITVQANDIKVHLK